MLTRKLWNRFRKRFAVELRVASMDEQMEDLVDQGYLVRNGTHETTGEPLYSVNYMKHPEATPADEEDVVLLKMEDGEVVPGLRIFLSEGYKEA